MSVFGLIKRESTSAIPQRIVKIISGVGSGISAMIGAAAVMLLAMILHIPMLVDEKTMGKRSM